MLTVGLEVPSEKSTKPPRPFLRHYSRFFLPVWAEHNDYTGANAHHYQTMLHRTFDRLLQTLLIFGVVLLLGSRIVGVYHHDQSLVQQVSFKVVNVGRTYDPTPSNPSLRYSLILRGLGTNTTSILSNVTFNLSVDGLSVGRVNFERIHILPFYTQLSVGAYKPELGVRFTTYDMGTILALAGRPSGELAGHCL